MARRTKTDQLPALPTPNLPSNRGEETIHLPVTPSEITMVVAALRWWQSQPAAEFEEGQDRAGTHFERHLPLTTDEIDALCDRCDGFNH